MWIVYVCFLEFQPHPVFCHIDHILITRAQENNFFFLPLDASRHHMRCNFSCESASQWTARWLIFWPAAHAGRPLSAPVPSLLHPDGGQQRLCFLPGPVIDEELYLPGIVSAARDSKQSRLVIQPSSKASKPSSHRWGSSSTSCPPSEEIWMGRLLVLFAEMSCKAKLNAGGSKIFAGL